VQPHSPQPRQPKIKDSTLVIAIATLIAVTLAFLTYYINFWPSDSYKPYNPTAAQLFELPYLSKMHDLPQEDLNRLNMRAKETLILGIAIMQKILKDNQSLYPNILLLILAVYVSTLLFYHIFKRLFDHRTGLLAAFLFATNFFMA